MDMINAFGSHYKQSGRTLCSPGIYTQIELMIFHGQYNSIPPSCKFINTGSISIDRVSSYELLAVLTDGRLNLRT